MTNSNDLMFIIYIMRKYRVRIKKIEYIESSRIGMI